MNQEKVIEIIFDELRKAEKKFPGWPNDPIHGATIVGEEAGELLKAALDYFRDIGMMQAILAALAERTDGPSEGERKEILAEFEYMRGFAPLHLNINSFSNRNKIHNLIAGKEE